MGTFSAKPFTLCDSRHGVQVIVGFFRSRMLEAPFKKLIFQLVRKRLNGLFFSPGNLREDVFRCVVTSVFKTGGLFLRSCCVYVLVDSEQLGISEYPVRVLALNGVHLQLLSHVEGVVDGNTLDGCDRCGACHLPQTCTHKGRSPISPCTRVLVQLAQKTAPDIFVLRRDNK